MMSRISTVFLYILFTFVVFAAANSPTTTTVTVTVTGPASTQTEPASQCDTGDLQCCNSVESASNPIVGTIFGLLGIIVTTLDFNVGITCSPIVGVLSGSSCTQQPVCCENNNFNGIINLGCSPVSL